VVLYDEYGVLKVCSLQHSDPEKTRYVQTYSERYPIDDPPFREMLERREPTLIEKIDDAMLARSARDEEHLALLRSLDMHAAIIAPLVSRDRLLGGVIMYSAESRRAFDRNDVEVARSLAERAAAAIENARLLAAEQRARRRLQFIGKAAAAVYETLDLTASFGELARLIAAEFGDFAVAMRLGPESTIRVIAAAHRDSEKDEIVRQLVGVRTMHTEAEKSFARSLRENRITLQDNLKPEIVAQSMWPYLATEVIALEPRGSLTIPLHSRGTTYGAIIVYYSGEERRPSAADADVLAEVGQHASVAMENAEVFERERRMSETLQDSLLPPSLPHLPGMHFDAVYLPSASVSQVGGDWYDAFQLEDGCVVLNAGDVTGRGVSAAVVMGKVRNLFAIAPSYERDPARILDTVESVMARRYPNVIITAFLGIIDPRRRTMRFANAGHPLPLLRRTHGVEELRAEGLPLGLRREAAPTESRTVDITDARLIVLYTDGLVEARHDLIGGYRRLHEVVSSDAVLHTHNPARFIEESCLSERADDDVAILTVAFEMSKRWSFDAENAKAAQDARGEFVQYLRDHAENPDEISAAELIFGELIGNVVRHAPGAIDIDLEWADHTPTLHVLDRGPAFNSDLPLPLDPLCESGRGLYIVRQLATDVRVEHVPGYGNHVTAGLPLRRKFE
jgi:GAF domain-containing protein/anti-sigma regulatory factor (Ser/Thr protein kinase)